MVNDDISGTLFFKADHIEPLVDLLPNHKPEYKVLADDELVERYTQLMYEAGCVEDEIMSSFDKEDVF